MLQALQASEAAFAELNAQVLGISGDSLTTHAAYARRHGITFPLLADEQGKNLRLLGGGRLTYLIDRQGVVRACQRGVPDVAALLRQVRELTD